MTKTVVAMADTYRRRLREAALDQHGYITTHLAEELGVPTIELRKLSARGGLTNIAYGLYRVDDIPQDQWGPYLEAVLRVGPDAYLIGDAVLAMHNLGLVNPARLRVGTPHRVRAKLPAHIEVVHAALAPCDLTTYEGVPSATVARALLDCRGTVRADRLVEAVDVAEREGLMRRKEAAAVRAVIEETDDPT
jgi:predicted transcriptional regulator of viral defense system